MTDYLTQHTQLDLLKNLDLSNNKLEILPHDIGNFTALRSLRLEQNPLQMLSTQIRYLINLEVFSLPVGEHTVTLQNEQIKQVFQLMCRLYTQDKLISLEEFKGLLLIIGIIQPALKHHQKKCIIS